MTRWRANSKLTLSLRVLGTRDDGFHELDALTVSVSEPHDELTIELGGNGIELEITGPAAVGVARGNENLATRAARALRVQAVRIALRKHIPAGAGLGGGSADAATVLVALDRLLDLGLSIDELATVGATLGSDVPFCVRGGVAHMRGRGERIEPAELSAPLHVLVAVPRFSISTPAVYRAWDELGGPRSTRVMAGPRGVGDLANDLEPAAERVEPRLREFRERLEENAGAAAILAGSGSACAVLFDDQTAANEACERVAAAAIASTCCVGVTRDAGVEAMPIEP